MKRLLEGRRGLAVIGVLLPLLAFFAYAALRSGPLAPVAVTVATVETRSVAPSLFGIGTVGARYRHQIGPTFAGRVLRLEVDVGDAVEAGQVLGEMDPVDFDERIRAQSGALDRADAALREALARQAYAGSQLQRYEALLEARLISEETVATLRQNQQVADAAANSARGEVARNRADLDATRARRDDLRLVAPIAGLVVARSVESGTTVVAGQAVLELIDPSSLWIDARFDQISSAGLSAGLDARIRLRSRQDETLSGRVLRLEPLADAVTEETMARIVFERLPSPLPPIGELVEVTVDLPPQPPAPVVPNAAIRRVNGNLGVWRVAEGDELEFVAVVLGRGDLEGSVAVRQGLAEGDRIVVYTEKAIGARSRIRIVERIPGVTP